MAKKQITSQDEMSFLDHLEELRWHLIRATLAIVIVGVVAFIFKDFIFDDIIFAPARPDFISYDLLCQIANIFGSDKGCVNEMNFIIQNRTMGGQFNAAIWTSIIVGVVVAFPYVIYVFLRCYKSQKHVFYSLLRTFYVEKRSNMQPNLVFPIEKAM